MLSMPSLYWPIALILSRLSGQAAERRRIANKAAERRRNATLGCGGDKKHPGGSDRQHQKPDIVAEVDRAARESIVIDLTGESDNVSGSAGGPVQKSSTKRRRRQASASSSAVAPAPSERKGTRKPAQASFPVPSRAPKVIVIDDDDGSDDDIQIVSMKPAKASNKPKVIPPSRRSTAATPGANGSRSRSSTIGKTAAQPPIIPTTWACPRCTLLNSAEVSSCQACDVKLAPVHANKASMYLFAAEGWVCESAGCLTLNEQTRWSCATCLTVKTSSAKG